MPAETVRRPWWSYLRFGVRTMLVAVLVIGGGLAWIVRSARIQREAVAAIRKGHAGVYYDWMCKDGVPIRNAKPWWPRWLVDRVGVDYFSHVSFVWCRGSDAELFHVGHLYQLERLDLAETEVSDAGLAHLKGLTNLQELNLAMTGVTDAGLAHLKRLTSLRSLTLGPCVTDNGLAHLSAGHLTRLEKLVLIASGVTDAGLEHLKGLTSLQDLVLNDTEVTCAGLPHLQRLPHLQSLALAGSFSEPSREGAPGGLNRASGFPFPL